MHAHSSREAAQVIRRIYRGRHLASVIVWCNILHEVITEHFCTQGVKKSAKLYRDDVFDKVFKPLKSCVTLVLGSSSKTSKLSPSLRSLSPSSYNDELTVHRMN